MKNFKTFLSSLCLVTALTLTVAPANTVYADGNGGPQGGSNSTTAGPQAEDLTYEELVWIIIFYLLGWY